MKKLEIAILLGLLLSIFTAVSLNHEQESLAAGVLRLHVIANSNDPFDQMLKLRVRDRILQESALFAETADVEQFKAKMAQNTDILAKAAEEEIGSFGRSDPVSVFIGESYFPTKEYEDIAFPAGRYQALKVVIGEGKGENWWCVCFPPLCTGAAIGNAEAYAKSTLDEKAVRLITAKEKKDTPYVIKFKLMELIGKVKEFSEKNK